MQFDRILTRTVTRLARAGMSMAKPATPVHAAAPDLYGSGSWTREWAGARDANDRAATSNTGDHADATARDGPAETPVRTRPLMSARDVKLFTWIADRLEAEAPACTLHACVALSAILASDRTPPDHDPFAGLTIDLLILDEAAQPVCALIREDCAYLAGRVALRNALQDGDVPVVDIPPRPSLSAIWAGIEATIPPK